MRVSWAYVAEGAAPPIGLVETVRPVPPFMPNLRATFNNNFKALCQVDARSGHNIRAGGSASNSLAGDPVTVSPSSGQKKLSVALLSAYPPRPSSTWSTSSSAVGRICM
jgi:hypothetical protein